MAFFSMSVIKASITLQGLGTFTVARCNARKGRNPSTGESLDIPAKTVPQFKPTTSLKAAVDN